MGERRMLSRAIVRSDAFCALEPKAQLLFYHLVMDADDDGVVGSIRIAQADARAGYAEMKALEAAKFILPIGKVYAIKHWWCMNTLRKDRYRPSTYQDELALLERKPDGSYTYRKDAIVENMGKTGAKDGCQLTATNVATQVGAVI